MAQQAMDKYSVTVRHWTLPTYDKMVDELGSPDGMKTVQMENAEIAH